MGDMETAGLRVAEEPWASNSKLCLSVSVIRFLDFCDIHVARRVCWEWYSVYSSHEVEKYCLRQYGVPRRLRLSYWRHCANVSQIFRSESIEVYHKALRRRGSSLRGDDNVQGDDTLQDNCLQRLLEAEIMRDVKRTFTYRPLFHVEHGIGQRMLFNVLSAVASAESQVGYCQGMNHVAAVIIAVALGCEQDYCSASDREKEAELARVGVSPRLQRRIESDAFFLMRAFLTRFGMKDLWKTGVPQLKLRIFQFDKLIGAKLPKLHAHFCRIGLTPAFFASHWFLTLMSYSVPMHVLVRIWDVLFVERWKTIFRAGLSILASCENRMLSMNLEQLSRFFSNRHSDRLYEAGEEETKVPALDYHSMFSMKVSTRELTTIESEYLSHLLLNDSNPEISIDKSFRSNDGHSPEISTPDVGRVLSDVFLENPQLFVAAQKKLDKMDEETRNDVSYVRNKIEECEKLFKQSDIELQKLLREYGLSTVELNNLLELEFNLNNEIGKLKKATLDGRKINASFEECLHRLEDVQARIPISKKRVEELRNDVLELNLETEEYLEKKDSLSNQLQGILKLSEHVKSRVVRDLWAFVNSAD